MRFFIFPNRYPSNNSQKILRFCAFEGTVSSIISRFESLPNLINKWKEKNMGTKRENNVFKKESY
ncbi:hypothetical protein DespoDRAFT_01696 [Desulfobacter postgatei 2ac9]|uniref:Uncharacterized protein n=1 Tax=Desulfobacter postgatei 2ac9 TaxID=879212 RepID=I5B2A2_9BACT|nr:hypothetical protein DespoDRAFT_01696 [Desulfobacter postgatei 2ac9]